MQLNPFLSRRQSGSLTHPVSRQSTCEDEVFKPEAVSVQPEEEGMGGAGEENKNKKVIIKGERLNIRPQRSQYNVYPISLQRIKLMVFGIWYILTVHS